MKLEPLKSGGNVRKPKQNRMDMAAAQPQRAVQRRRRREQRQRGRGRMHRTRRDANQGRSRQQHWQR